MTMQSTSLLPALRKLPTGESRQRMDFREIMAGLVSTDRAMHAAEFASAVSLGMWAVFSEVNVDDNLAAAYEAQYPRLAADHSLHEHWQEMVDRGQESMDKFVDGLKGKVAEFETKEMLQAEGYTNVEIDPDPTNEIWDISAVDPNGQNVLIQVKSHAEGSASGVQGLMEANPDISYYVSSELYKEIADDAPELVDRMTDIGSTEELEGSVEEGLDLLIGNLGIDIPDGVMEIIPYAAAIMAGARLIYGALKAEKEFKTADRTTKNKIQVVRTLTLMSRMGPKTILSIVGGKGGAMVGGVAGASVGTVVPGVGNAIGGTVGTIGGGIAGVAGGYRMGNYLSKHLEPHMLNLALNITRLTHDDLFYYKNKPRIDDLALTFETRIREFTTTLALSPPAGPSNTRLALNPSLVSSS